MRWWLFRAGVVFCFVWMIMIVGLNVYIFITTKSYYSFFISAAAAPAIEFTRRFANYLLPIDEKRYKLAVIKEERKALKYFSNKKLVDKISTRKD